MLKRYMNNTACLCIISIASTSFASTTAPEMQWADSVIETAEEGPAVMIIPMNGQMHTDISNEIYGSLVERIKAAKPDLLVIELLSRDRRNEFAYLMGYGEREEFNRFDAKDLIDVAKVFYIELKSIPQVAWVQDSSGASTVLALSWEKMYMSKDAHLRATYLVSDFNNIKADDTRGKIREFRVIHSKVVAEYGKRSHALVRAFVDPDVPLSGTWKGKEVVWEESTNGDFVIDIGEKQMPKLTATTATEVGISKGIVQSLNDVLLAQGIREYHIVGRDITNDINEYVEDWRKQLEKADEIWLDSQQHATWATGEETERYLRLQLKGLKKLLRMIERSEAVKMRLGMKYRLTEKNLKQLIDQIEEALRLLREAEEEGGRGRGGGGGGPIGGGGS